MKDKLNKLKSLLLESHDLTMVASLLNWDQNTYMPTGGAEARGRQRALLSRISQEKSTSPEVGKLIDELVTNIDYFDEDSNEARMILKAKRDYDRAVRIPPPLIAELFAHFSKTFQAWMQAKSSNDFSLVAPMLEKTLQYSLKIAEFFPEMDHPADALIDQFDPGMTVAQIKPLFANLRKELVPLVQNITNREIPNDRFLKLYFSKDDQINFGERVIMDIGYDFSRGRQDLAPHPFTTKFSIDDVRITTRVNENDLIDAFFSTVHEAGHALYEQNISKEFEGTPLDRGTSSGIHESSSRLWENVVGRSYEFWRHYYPILQEYSGDNLATVSLDEFYRAINKVTPSLIRTDADEVTYNLHVLIRFGLELDLLEGKLTISELPKAWNDRYEEYLGVRPDNDTLGVMQDIHWFSGPIGGAFQGYTLGNIFSALIYSSALKASPGIPKEMEKGNFEPLRNWLSDNVYQFGSKYPPIELLKRFSDEPLSIKPYMKYLNNKYKSLYNLK